VALIRNRTIPTERPPLSAELVPTFADRGCRVLSATDPHGPRKSGSAGGQFQKDFPRKNENQQMFRYGRLKNGEQTIRRIRIDKYKRWS
jgi:hypothetical protein